MIKISIADDDEIIDLDIHVVIDPTAITLDYEGIRTSAVECGRVAGVERGKSYWGGCSSVGVCEVKVDGTIAEDA